jgi:hypothetical protein
MEAVKTNVYGTQNVIRAAGQNGVKKVICLSTDKAAYPINAMGISKAMMEKVAIAESRSLKDTTVCLTRYGNVMASRGSVIPLFVKQLNENKPLTITDPNMTRFLMSLNDFIYLWERDRASLMKRPSIDRIDGNGNYEIRNCRFIEGSENSERSIIHKRIPIRSVDPITGKVTDFKSLLEAEECGHSRRSIRRSINSVSEKTGRRKHAGKYWEYKEAY